MRAFIFMTISEIQNQIFLLTNSTSNDFADSDLLASVNRYYHKAMTIILRSSDSWDYDDTSNTDFPILTASLVADQQEYTLPTDVLKVKRVEITYDGTNWDKAEPFDINNRSDATDATSIANDFNTTQPFYDVQYGAFFLYPTPTANSTNGLKIWITREITEFTSGDLSTGTKKPSIDVMFHEYLSMGPAYEFGLAKGMPQVTRFRDEITRIEQEMTAYYGNKMIDTNMHLAKGYVNYK